MLPMKIDGRLQIFDGLLGRYAIRACPKQGADTAAPRFQRR
jgi:hypothetical protein